MLGHRGAKINGGTRHINSIVLVWDHDILDARVVSISSAKARASAVSTTERFRPQQVAPSECPTACVSNTHSGTAHFPPTRTHFLSCTPQDCAFILKHCLRVKKGFWSHSDLHHSFACALHRQSDGLRRAHLRRRPGHHHLLDNPVCALSHNEPVCLSGPTSLDHRVARTAHGGQGSHPTNKTTSFCSADKLRLGPDPPAADRKTGQ